MLPHLQHPPAAMVDEGEVIRLHLALRDALGDATAEALGQEAGRRTADYLLAHRIPRPVQWLLRALPARLAAALLLRAIRRHAWTFAGSGRFSATAAGSRVVLSLANNPLCRGLTLDEPGCRYYAGTFERLFQVLVHRQARVVETCCEACGASHCRFEVDWPGRR
jgi:divinyl protochlorophyllide a 8-vinyl-reductase